MSKMTLESNVKAEDSPPATPPKSVTKLEWWQLREKIKKKKFKGQNWTSVQITGQNVEESSPKTYFKKMP